MFITGSRCLHLVITLTCNRMMDFKSGGSVSVCDCCAVEEGTAELAAAAVKRLRRLRMCPEGRDEMATHLIVGSQKRTLKVWLLHTSTSCSLPTASAQWLCHTGALVQSWQLSCTCQSLPGGEFVVTEAVFYPITSKRTCWVHSGDVGDCEGCVAAVASMADSFPGGRPVAG